MLNASFERVDFEFERGVAMLTFKNARIEFDVERCTVCVNLNFELFECESECCTLRVVILTLNCSTLKVNGARCDIEVAL